MVKAKESESDEGRVPRGWDERLDLAGRQGRVGEYGVFLARDTRSFMSDMLYLILRPCCEQYEGKFQVQWRMEMTVQSSWRAEVGLHIHLLLHAGCWPLLLLSIFWSAAY